MHWKFWKPIPLEIQSFGDPTNFGYTPLTTDTVTTVPPPAETEAPEAVLTDAQASRAYRDVKRESVLKKNLGSLTDCKETLMSTAPSAVKLSGSAKTNMVTKDAEVDWIEELLRGNV